MSTEPTSKRGKDKQRPWTSNLGWLLLLLLLGPGMWWLLNREPVAQTLRYGELMRLLQTDPAAVRFQEVRVGPTEIRGKIITIDAASSGKDQAGKHEQVFWFRTLRPGAPHEGLVELLRERVGPSFQGEEDESVMRGVYSVLMFVLSIALALLVGVVMFRWLLGGSSPLSFGRSRHKLYAEKDTEITFKDVAGIDEAVAELREIVDFLKQPQKYQRLGGRIPKGVLLVGPPGTGKTLLAKAVAGEAHVPFFSMSGSEFVEMFVGVGASRVRDLFGQAESQAPCIIFIDELDALGKTRAGNAVGSHDEREQTLNQLLVEMDGFDSNRGVIIMAATNRPEMLDAALLRPGRFDRTVVVDRPDIVGREAILKVHSQHVKMGDNVDLRRVAALTPGSVGADLANLVNEAALMAARNSKDEVTMAEFDEAVERSAVGLERKSRIMSAEEKQRVAYHEAGHALVAIVLPNTDPVHKVTIIPRGVGALGYVLQRPEEDRYLRTQSELESHIKVALGGTIAEEIVYKEISNGATSDLEQANRIARRMVTELGMSPLGRMSYPDGGGAVFLPGSPGFGEGERRYSEQTAREIDLQTRKIIDDATEVVRQIIGERQAALAAVAQRLFETEVIDGSELRAILEQHYPGPKLVPGTLPLESPPRERREETGGERGASQG